MIEAEYTITYTDYKNAQRLYLKRRPAAMIGYVLLVWILPIFGVSMALALWFRIYFGRGPGDQAGVMVSYLWLIVVFPLIRWLRLRRGYRNLFAKGAPRVVRLSADEDQVVSTIPDRCEGRFYWKTIEDSAEDKNGMILFVHQKQFLVVPHHALTQAQWEELRGLVAAKTAQRVT